MHPDSVDSETHLIRALQAGSEAGFAQLYDAYADLLYGIILRIVRHPDDAANLLQDCFVKIWRYARQYDPARGRLATWLINIARNTAIDYTRSNYFSRYRNNQVAENIVDTDKGPTAVLPVETLGLRQLVAQLSPPCRAVIESMYFEGYTQQEIADRTGIPLGTVKSRTRQALRDLRQYFSDP